MSLERTKLNVELLLSFVVKPLRNVISWHIIGSLEVKPEREKEKEREWNVYLYFYCSLNKVYFLDLCTYK